MDGKFGMVKTFEVILVVLKKLDIKKNTLRLDMQNEYFIMTDCQTRKHKDKL